MIWRVLTHIRMRWHEVAADLAARFAGASMNSATRHLEVADRLFEKLRGRHEE